MKNIFLILLVLSFIAPSFGQRFATDPKKGNNTGSALTYAYLAPAYSATTTITPNASFTIVKPSAVSGALNISVTDTKSQIGDELQFMLVSTGAARTVTLGTNLKGSATTIALDSAQVGTLRFMYNGTDFIEISRAKE